MLESITITFALALPLLTVALPLLAVVLLGRWLRKRYLYKTPARDDKNN